MIKILPESNDSELEIKMTEELKQKLKDDEMIILAGEFVVCTERALEKLIEKVTMDFKEDGKFIKFNLPNLVAKEMRESKAIIKVDEEFMMSTEEGFFRAVQLCVRSELKNMITSALDKANIVKH